MHQGGVSICYVVQRQSCYSTCKDRRFLKAHLGNVVLGGLMTVTAAEDVFPAVDLTMYEPPASVTVSAPQYEAEVIRVISDQEARQPPVSEYSTYGLAQAPTMRQSVIRLNQKIMVSKL